MREFQERRRMKKFLHSRYAIVLLILICLLLAKGVWGVFEKYENSRELAERTEAELSGLEARYSSLSRDTVLLDTDQGKEREIRQRFGAVKEGEVMVVVVDNSASVNATPDYPKNWWEAILGFFKRD